jgi:hypothetical protein
MDQLLRNPRQHDKGDKKRIQIPRVCDGYKISLRSRLEPHFFLNSKAHCLYIYRVFHFEVRISAPRLGLESKSQQILTLVQARSIWDFQPLGAKARIMPADFSDVLDATSVCSGTSENDAVSDCCLSLAEVDIGG